MYSYILSYAILIFNKPKLEFRCIKHELLPNSLLESRYIHNHKTAPFNIYFFIHKYNNRGLFIIAIWC